MTERTLFGSDPARDERFTVVQKWSEMRNLDASDPRKQIEFLHRQMNEEINSIEMCASSIADFPDADWEVRMELARQCWDEVRHALAFRRLLEARGGRVGEFPVMNFQYRIVSNLPELFSRLAVQNRSFEAAGLDAIQHGIDAETMAGDEEFVYLFESQLADEIQHVRFANDWVKKLVDRGGPRAVFAMARDVARANEALTAVAGEAIRFYPVSDDLRKEAGFTEGEIETARTLTGG